MIKNLRHSVRRVAISILGLRVKGIVFSCVCSMFTLYILYCSGILNAWEWLSRSSAVNLCFTSFFSFEINLWFTLLFNQFNCGKHVEIVDWIVLHRIQLPCLEFCKFFHYFISTPLNRIEITTVLMQGYWKYSHNMLNLIGRG